MGGAGEAGDGEELRLRRHEWSRGYGGVLQSHAIAVRASARCRVGAASSSAAASNGGSRAPPPAYYSDPFDPCNLLAPAVANALLTAYAQCGDLPAVLTCSHLTGNPRLGREAHAFALKSGLLDGDEQWRGAGAWRSTAAPARASHDDEQRKGEEGRKKDGERG